MSPEWRCPLNRRIPKEKLHCTSLQLGKNELHCHSLKTKSRYCGIVNTRGFFFLHGAGCFGVDRLLEGVNYDPSKIFTKSIFKDLEGSLQRSL